MYIYIYKRIERLLIIILNKVILVFVFPNIIISIYEHEQRQKMLKIILKYVLKLY